MTSEGCDEEGTLVEKRKAASTARKRTTKIEKIAIRDNVDVAASQNTNIQTAGNIDPSLSRMRMTAYSMPSLSTLQGIILEEAKRELRFPDSVQTFKMMLLDSSISTALGLIEILLKKVKWDVYLPQDSSEEEKAIQRKLKWNMQSMERPWAEYISEIASYLAYGFHTPEKIYTRFKDSPHGAFIGLLDLATISQDTVVKWIFEKGTGRLVGLRQNLTYIKSDLRDAEQSMWADVPRKKFILFRHAPKRNNPAGTSPLRSCFIPWKLRTLVEEYETVGVSRDLGGIPVIGVNVGYLSKASEDPAGNEAQVVAELKRQAANLHAGEQAYVLKPLAYDEQGKDLFSFDLVGITGSGGKQYSTSDIIQRHDTKLLMAFFADVLKLGNNQHGSFSLADAKTNILSLTIESHLQNIADTLNHDLMPQIYEMNKWEYDPETSCKFKFGDVEKQDLDALSKFVQRVFSVGAIRPSEEIETYLRDIAFDLDGFDVSGDTEIKTEASSRAGDGMKTAGPGTSDSPFGNDDDSASNLENSA